MSQPENKKPGTSQADAAATDKDTYTKPAQTPPGKDPNEYDPVGMAGKPAGILLELGEEASEEAKAQEARKALVPRDKSGR
jgi:hypothetical protein